MPENDQFWDFYWEMRLQAMETCICRELLNGYDLATEEGQRMFAEKDLSNKVCKLCVQSATEIVETLM